MIEGLGASTLVYGAGISGSAFITYVYCLTSSVILIELAGDTVFSVSYA